MKKAFILLSLFLLSVSNDLQAQSRSETDAVTKGLTLRHFPPNTAMPMQACSIWAFTGVIRRNTSTRFNWTGAMTEGTLGEEDSICEQGTGE